MIFPLPPADEPHFTDSWPKVTLLVPALNSPLPVSGDKLEDTVMMKEWRPPSLSDSRRVVLTESHQQKQTALYIPWEKTDRLCQTLAGLESSRGAR